MVRIGLISDTHGYLDPAIHSLFLGVNHILHAGDIGDSWIIQELQGIAPVTAVLGNNDLGLAFRETEEFSWESTKFLIHQTAGVLRMVLQPQVHLA